MDWRMPGMDGLEATRRLRAGDAGPAAATLAVLGLTANAFQEDRAACLEAGMNDVLTKPVERRRLLVAVSDWAARPSATDP
jgi:CheY-like chemotaxis protein